MKTIKQQRESSTDKGPLALHIRRLRQWYGDHGISQADLAELAGISPRLLRAYEDSRRLPPVVELLLRIALAMEVPMETLIDPRLIERIARPITGRRDEINQRRPPLGSMC